MEAGLNEYPELKLNNYLADVNFRGWTQARKNKFSMLLVAHTVAVGCYLFDLSSLNGWPLVSQLYRLRSSHNVGEHFRHGSDRANAKVKAFHLFRVTIRDVGGYLPAPQNIADALRMREDKHVVKFRKRLGDFFYSIKQGDAVAAEDMRRAVVDASQSLRRLERVRRLGNIAAAFSLPIDLAAELCGAGLGLGNASLTVSALGALSSSSAKLNSLKHDWVLFGFRD